MNEVVTIISLTLQLIGVIFFLSNHVLFYRKARKFGSLKKGFVDKAFPRWAMSDKQLEESDAEEALKGSPLAELLYKNYKNSVIGIVITLIGVLLNLVNFGV